MAASPFLLHRLRLRSFQGLTLAPPHGHRLWGSATSSPEEGTRTDYSDVEVDDPEWKDTEEKIVRDIEPIFTLTRQILHSPRYKNGELLTMEDERAIAENVLIYHPDYEDKIGSGLDGIMVMKHIVCRAEQLGEELNWKRPCLVGTVLESSELKGFQKIYGPTWGISVKVDRHPLYIFPRCLFVVRTDGSWIDFSYRTNEGQKGLTQLGPGAGCPTRFSVTLHKSKLGEKFDLDVVQKNRLKSDGPTIGSSAHDKFQKLLCITNCTLACSTRFTKSSASRYQERVRFRKSWGTEIDQNYGTADW
ncbi:unnamed protein product [Sphenostylis stenocarpa]|uniref:Uncharacterized protein n=1 Tax=Sphenostylis stenocarpa TaxID=92480 RepID=A0AA86SXK4_9FABA|nr:unnamed protein product [Sphenostylis stenocarpa]